MRIPNFYKFGYELFSMRSDKFNPEAMKIVLEEYLKFFGGHPNVEKRVKYIIQEDLIEVHGAIIKELGKSYHLEYPLGSRYDSYNTKLILEKDNENGISFSVSPNLDEDSPLWDEARKQNKLFKQSLENHFRNI